MPPSVSPGPEPFAGESASAGPRLTRRGAVALRKQIGNLLFLAGALGLALAALALRLYRLEFQSLWWDEGVSLYLAGESLAALTVAKDFAVDLHPPLYHALLWAWTAAVGPSAFAARYLSVALGVLIVPATIALGRLVGGRVAGLIAGLLVAVSPFLIFYSQEARMYSLAPLLGVLSILVVARCLRVARMTGRDAAVLTVVNVAALYSYYYLGFLIVAESAAVAAVLIWSSRLSRGEGSTVWSGFLGRWVLVQALTALAFVPWLVVFAALSPAGAGDLAIQAGDAVRHSAVGFARETLVAFSVGFNGARPWSIAAVGALSVLAAVGALSDRSREGRSVRLILVASVLLPLALSYAIHVWRPFYYPRFIAFAQPVLMVLAAAGAARLLQSPFGSRLPALVGRLSAVLALLLLAIAILPVPSSLRAHYSIHRTAFSTADYRETLRSLASLAQPGDLVLGAYPWQLGYARGYLPNASITTMLIGSPVVDPARGRKADDRIWLLRYSPDRGWLPDRTEDALHASLPVAFLDQFGDARLTLFSAAPVPAEVPLARLGTAIALDGADVGLGERLAPGSEFDLVLRWRALSPPDGDYTVFTQAIGPDGRVHAQHDSQPAAGASSTSGWRTGAVVVDRHHLRLAADAPVGDYCLQIGMYDPKTGARLPVGRSPEEPDRVIVWRFAVAR